jgi:hypothetical protein
MILIACTDDPHLVSIATKSAEKHPNVFGDVYQVFVDVVPMLGLNENLFVIAHGAYDGDEGRPVIGDKQEGFYLEALDLFKNLGQIIPNHYQGNVFVDACEAADFKATVSFIELLQSVFNSHNYAIRIFGTIGKSKGLIVSPDNPKWKSA